MPQIAVQNYKIFDLYSYEGLPSYVNLMHRLRGENFVPMNMQHIMMAFMAAANGKDYKQKDLWVKNFSHSSDGAAYNKDKIKIVLDAKALINIQPDTELIYGALLQTVEEYNSLEGEEIPRKYAKNRPQSKDDILRDPFWQALARHDMHLLREFRDAVFGQIKEARGEYEQGLAQLARSEKETDKEDAKRLFKLPRFTGNEAMGVYLTDAPLILVAQQKTPLMRAWFLTSIGGLCGAVGGGFLSDGARLIGLSNEDAAKIDETLEQKVRTA